jgi:LacI family transcriptional regulator
MVTRKDVADRAGTSPAVVSYVLNGGPRTVSTDARRRVLTAVEELGYRPNAVARSLRLNRTMALGLIVPDNSNPFFAELARAMEDAAFGRGYTLLLGNAMDDDERETTYVRAFLDRQVDGLLVIPSHGAASWLGELERARVPCLVIDRALPWANVSCVVVDNEAGAFEATEHLVAHGHRSIACIAGPDDQPSAAARVRGWRRALQTHGLRAAQLCRGAFGRRAGYLAAQELSRRDPRPDAVFVGNDEQAVGVLAAAAAMGVAVPEDLAVVSFDGIPTAAYTVPSLTTVGQPFDELGTTVMTRMVQRIQDPAAPRTDDVLPVALCRRRSCGCPAGEPEPLR